VKSLGGAACIRHHLLDRAVSSPWLTFCRVPIQFRWNEQLCNAAVQRCVVKPVTTCRLPIVEAAKRVVSRFAKVRLCWIPHDNEHGAFYQRRTVSVRVTCLLRLRCNAELQVFSDANYVVVAWRCFDVVPTFPVIGFVPGIVRRSNRIHSTEFW